MTWRLSHFLPCLLPMLLPMPLGAGPSHAPTAPTDAEAWSSASPAWSDPRAHSHFSPLGTPLIHSFRLEPAFTHRDGFVDYSFREEEGGDEHEIAMELEWAWTDRLGLIMEVPYRFLDPDDGASVDGWGDLAIAPRLLLWRSDRFLLAGSLEIEIPTGDDDRGLGEGELALAPSVSTWWDLGAWWSLNTQCGIEHVLDSDETEFLFRGSLIHTFGRQRLLGDHRLSGEDHDHEHGHGTAGLFSIILEVDGAVGLSGEDSGDVAVEGIAGFAYGVSEFLDLRLGIQFPLNANASLDRGVTLGAIWHF